MVGRKHRDVALAQTAVRFERRLVAGQRLGVAGDDIAVALDAETRVTAAGRFVVEAARQTN